MIYLWIILAFAALMAILESYHLSSILWGARKSLLKLRDKNQWGNSWKCAPKHNLSNIIYGLNMGGSYDFKNPLNTRLSPWVIGSGMEELIELQREGFLFEAKQALEIFRSHSGYCDPELIKYDLEEVGLGLEDIETSEEELERLHKEQFYLSRDWPDWMPLPENWKNM